ncbi:hydroxymethylbilane synthase [Aestuariivirga litoralis]|uniref:hydroxymethylbilane synthase n=1 Tax=Aestuariivirga litoralis TaxID=2650924 RepID=UPI0018C79F13|nr:hydroxymethylbilane synthase [Aestuariivirga litoralis]MBG1232498.1 hydroxymethylbilane synthase [Aestuariivirga litoralis]
MTEQRLKIGTRGSPLALAQAHETRSRLMTALGRKAEDFDIVVIKTTGDMVRDRPLSEIGGKGLFTKELEDALLSGAIDLAVHSLKDMPSALPEGLEIVSVLPREDVRDAFISVKWPRLMALPQGARLGSSSVRRTAQALRLRPDLVPVQFRGNVETRLQKLKDGVAEATFLAVAGLKRLGLGSMITTLIGTDEMLPCVAQGAIGIEINSARAEMRDLVAKINHEPSQFAVDCERAFMAALDGSCRTPIAGHAVIKNGEIHFRGEALTLDGKHHFPVEAKGAVADRARIGREAGEDVKKRGGALIAY